MSRSLAKGNAVALPRLPSNAPLSDLLKIKPAGSSGIFNEGWFNIEAFTPVGNGLLGKCLNDRQTQKLIVPFFVAILVA